MKRVVADNRRKSGASLDEGKKEMSFEVYKILCEELYNRNGDEHFFVHAFLTAEWNLISRAKTVSIYICSTSSGGRIV